jgi:hypothetical protein
MGVAKMFARIALVIAAARIGIPLISDIIGMSVMRLVKARIIDGLSHTLHAHEEHRGNK